MDYTKTLEATVVETTKLALEANNITVVIADNAESAKQKVLQLILQLIPEGSEVFTMTSATLDSIGLPEIINESGRYDSVRTNLNNMNREKQSREMRKLGAAPDYAVGSVHAVTQDGSVLIASNTGSQLPAYVYGAGKVIWVVGMQKIVPDQNAAIKRIYDYVLPLESERARKAYGMPGSFVSKLLIVNKEVQPGRITVVLVKQPRGF
jgi:hypothetical protein